MLIRFHVSNFLSFDEEIELSLIPGKARKHPNHIVTTQEGCDFNLLKAAIIYGANASGKSNLVKAMSFAKKLIAEGTRPQTAISRTHFKLGKDNVSRPSKFEFEFKVGPRCYIYGFEVDSQRVYEEWLYEIKKTTEMMLFERVTTAEGTTSIDFGKIGFSNSKEKKFLDFVAMSTRPNQLFLTESMERNVKHFADVYRWFKDMLVIIYPRSRFLSLAAQTVVDDNFGLSIAKALEKLGTGIIGLALEPINLETEFPEEIIQDLRKRSPTDTNLISLSSTEHEQYLITWSNGNLEAKKLMFKHRMANSDDLAILDAKEESDGTRRLLDLLPEFANLTHKDRVIIIDELDRSLHPQLSYKLLELFLADSTNSRQIIATTHEEHLLDLDLLRRDEVWFIEKDQFGASHIYSLEEFTPRYDADIEKGYLMGRFGAIPVLGNLSFAR